MLAGHDHSNAPAFMAAVTSKMVTACRAIRVATGVVSMHNGTVPSP
ncbi:MAG TPA: hypothetical protein VH499_03110 [Reyranella sp.]